MDQAPTKTGTGQGLESARSLGPTAMGDDHGVRLRQRAADHHDGAWATAQELG
jgi:hypothetical protein